MKPIANALLITALFFAVSVNGQTTYTVASTPEFTIKGTSNVHDWEETVQKINGTGSFLLNEDGSLTISSLLIKVECRDIKSTHGSIMDNKTYDALKAEKNPQITYNLSTAITNIIPSSTGTSMIAKGQVTIAGVTKPIDLQVKISSKADGSFVCEGSKKIKMTDFGISPPTAFMGAMKVGDEVVLTFKTIMQKK